MEFLVCSSDSSASTALVMFKIYWKEFTRLSVLSAGMQIILQVKYPNQR